MGALSSWPSMALVHHFVVQYAAYEAGLFPSKGLFTDYVLLGDDIAIGNERVASRYVTLMDQLGVTIGLAKSYVSKHGLVNFANQTYLGTTVISPLSLREALQVKDITSACALGARALERGFCLQKTVESAVLPIESKGDSVQAKPVLEFPEMDILTVDAPIAEAPKVRNPTTLAPIRSWSVAALIRAVTGPEAWASLVVPALAQGRLTTSIRLALYVWLSPTGLYGKLGFDSPSFVPLTMALKAQGTGIMTLRDWSVRGDNLPHLDALKSLVPFLVEELLSWLSGEVDKHIENLIKSSEGLSTFVDRYPEPYRQPLSIYWSGYLDDSLSDALDAQIDVRRLIDALGKPEKTVRHQISGFKDRVILQQGGGEMNFSLITLAVRDILGKLQPAPGFPRADALMLLEAERKNPILRINRMIDRLIKALIKGEGTLGPKFKADVQDFVLVPVAPPVDSVVHPDTH